MSNGSDVRNHYLGATLAGGLGIVALLFLPFAGFTEKITYWYDYGITGVGTYGLDGLQFFTYPATLFYVQLLLVAGAILLVRPLLMTWKAYRESDEPSSEDLRTGLRLSAGVAVGAVVLLLATMFVLLPGVEDQTIWDTERGGFLSGWWPGFGAFVAIIGAGGMAWVLRQREGGAVPAPPPPP